MIRRLRTRRQVDQRFQALQQMAVELIQATTQHDLLHFIVRKATELLQCDGGSLYLLADERHLAFEVALNHSVPFSFQRTTLPTEGASIAAWVYRTARSVRIEDVYELPADAEYRFDGTFDQRAGYRTRTMVALPLVSSKGLRLGVLQLVNRKRRPNDPWPSEDPAALARMPAFSEDDEALLESFAALASASIEKSNLYRDIENLLKGIIRASVHAIESRDPVTSGHSERVALLTVDLARRVSDSDAPALRDLRFSQKQLQELQYASLLHDFGKISVQESVLLKAKKLFDWDLERIRARIDTFSHGAEIQLLWDMLHRLAEEKRPPTDLDVARLRREVAERRGQLEGLWHTVRTLNEPTVLDESRTGLLEDLKTRSFPLPGGETRPLLEPREAKLLAIKRGSLSEEERTAIENHVTSTYLFLKEIPWTEDFRNVPEIAYAHHEKLNGLGYPRRLKEPEIPVQSRMMAICDVYDALVAADRPYKRAVPVDKALDILRSEAKAGALDGRFLDVFLEARVYENPDFLRLNRARRAA